MLGDVTFRHVSHVSLSITDGDEMTRAKIKKMSPGQPRVHWRRFGRSLLSHDGQTTITCRAVSTRPLSRLTTATVLPLLLPRAAVPTLRYDLRPLPNGRLHYAPHPDLDQVKEEE